MTMKKVIHRTMICTILLLFLIPLVACDDGPSGPSAEDPRPIPTVYLSGTLELSEGCTVDYSDLKVLSFADSDEISAEGRYRLQVPVTSSHQLLLFVTKEEEESVYICIIDPVSESVISDDSTTALALLLMNPYLLDAESGYRDEFMSSAVTHPEFSSLVSMLQAAYAANARTALSYSSNPLIYQLASQISKETFETLGGRWTFSGGDWGEVPQVIDAPGGDIAFVNSRSIFYTAAVYEWAEPPMTMQDLVTVDCWDGLYEMSWGWPATYVPVLTNTQYEMGDGYFMIELYRKGNESYSSPSGWWSTPEGRALALNTARTVLYFVEQYTGYMGGYNADQAQALINNLEIPADIAADLESAIEEGNTLAFAKSFGELVQEVSVIVARWFWNGTETTETLTYLDNSSQLLKSVCQGFAASSYGTTEGTFFWDFVHAPDSIVYFVAQEGDSLWFFEPEENLPPTAIFTSSPDYGIPGTVFRFDASDSYDGEDPLEDLQFRWDWENDGTWDTAWSGDVTAYHSYDEIGTYTVVLEVKDTGDLTDTATDDVLVQEFMITVTEPTASTVWTHFETDLLIEWEYPAVPAGDSVISIILYEGDFVHVKTLATAIPNSGSWTYQGIVYGDWEPGYEYRIYIDGVVDDFGVSEYFTIEPSTGQDIITVTEPNTSTVWTHFEQDIVIEWGYPGVLRYLPEVISGDSVNFELWKGGVYIDTYPETVPNTGSYTVPDPVSGDWEPGVDYQVKVIDNLNNFGVSTEFTIAPSTGANVIEVLIPDSTTQWTHFESDCRIIWEYPSVSSGDSVRLELWVGGYKLANLSENIENSGEYILPYLIPMNWEQGNSYQVKIIDSYSNWGKSDYFEILSCHGSDVITVISPESGDVWMQSEMVPNIEWEYPAILSGAYIQIKLVSDTVEVILAEWIDNEFNYNHPTPIPPDWGTGGNYRIQILDDYGNFGESDAFTISPAQCLLVADPNPMRDTIVGFVSSLGYSIAVLENYPSHGDLDIYELLIAMKPDTAMHASYFDSYISSGGSVFFNGIYLKLLGSPQWAGGSGFQTLQAKPYAHQAYCDNPLGASGVMKDDTLFYASNPEIGPLIMTEPGAFLETDAYLEVDEDEKYTVCSHIEHGGGRLAWTASWFCPWDNGISGYTTVDYRSYLESVYAWLINK